MCVLAFAWRAHPRWRLILAGNRDELHARPAAPLHRWPEAPGVIAGQDLESGGTWLGVSLAGRMAVITNHRSAGRRKLDPPSRGLLVRDLLTGTGAYAWPQVEDLAAFNPFQLITVADGGAALWSNAGSAPTRQTLGTGLYGLSNGTLDEPWPKTVRLKALTADWLAGPADDLEPLFAALADEARPADAALPATGLGTERERLHSAIFIRDPDYGTRCSTVVAVDANGAGRIVERRFGADGARTGETALAFKWAAEIASP